MFHEIDQDRIDRVRGMDITFVTTATTDDAGPGAAASPRLPVPDRTERRRQHGEDSAQGQAGPQAEVRASARYTRCQKCGRPRPSTASSACAGSACATWRTRASCPASPSPPGDRGLSRRTLRPAQVTAPIRRCRSLRGKPREKEAPRYDHDRPDRGHADPRPERQPGVPRHRDDAAQQDQGRHRRDPRQRGLHRRRTRSTSPAEGEVGKTLSITLKYGQNRERSIAGVRRISKPGLRVYAKSTGLPKVLGGLGIAIISTSQGLLTDRQAHRNRRGRRSRRLRLVSDETRRGTKTCHALAGCRSPSRPVSRSPSTASRSRSRARRARCSTASQEPITVARAENGELEVTPARRRAGEQVAARADPHPGRQHGRRRHRRLREEARDRRRRLPRRRQGPDASSSSRSATATRSR